MAAAHEPVGRAGWRPAFDRGGAFHKKQGLRIDFLLATQPAWQRVASVEIDREYRKKKDGLTPSDHAPVLADLG